MSNLAVKLSHSPPSHEVATVVALDDDSLRVRTARGERWATRATSCLVAPAAGDEVALFDTGDGRLYVIAILQSDQAGVEIAVDGDLRLSARGGTCSVTGTQGVALATEGRVSVRANEGMFLLEKLTVRAASLLLHTDAARVAARAVDGFFERVSQTAKLWHRKVEELDHLRTGRADYAATHEISMRAEHFVVGAEKLAKIDAEQIHIG